MKSVYEELSIQEPLLPTVSKSSMVPYDPAFVIGRIASLFISLKSSSNRSPKRVDDRFVISYLCSNPLGLVATVVKTCPIYVGRHRAKTAAWQFQEIQRLMAEFDLEHISEVLDGPLSSSQQAIALFGYSKQKSANKMIKDARKLLCEQRLKQAKSEREKSQIQNEFADTGVDDNAEAEES